MSDTHLETLARLLPLLPGTDRTKAALLGVQPANLSTWLAEHEGRARPPAEGRAGRRRWRAVNEGDVARLVELLRAHGQDVEAALATCGHPSNSDSTPSPP